MSELLLALGIVAMLALFGPSFVRGGLRQMLIVAVLSSLAAAGGAALFVFPGVQPSSFIVMMAGVSFGPGAGLVCGLLNALVSRLLTGMGPWLVWQAFLWGAMGVLAGLMRRAPWWLLAGTGFVWGFVFGWTMNLLFYSLTGAPFHWTGYLAACASSLTSDLAHGLTNAALLLLLGPKCNDIFHKSGGIP